MPGTTIMRLTRNVTVFAAIMAAWCIGSGLGLFNAFFLPSPWTLLATAKTLILDGVLVRNILVSLVRVIAGFTISMVLGLLLGLLVGLHRRAWDYLRTPLDFLRHIPPLAMTPMLILWCGIGETTKLAVIVLASFFPVFLNTASGVVSCDAKLLEVGRVLGLGPAATILRVILPSALPAILTGLRLGLGFAWRALIGAELIASASGLGHMIIDAEQFSRPDIVLVGIVTIGLLGLAMDAVMSRLRGRLAPWSAEGV